MEDFKKLGYFVKVEYNDYDYLYYFIDNIEPNIDIQTIMKDKLKDIPNGSSKFHCDCYELHEIVNDNYSKFKTQDQFLLQELFSTFHNNTNSDLIFANPNNFTIDTIVTLPHMQHVDRLRSLLNEIIDTDNNLNYKCIDKMLDILTMLKREEGVYG